MSVIFAPTTWSLSLSRVSVTWIDLPSVLPLTILRSSADTPLMSSTKTRGWPGPHPSGSGLPGSGAHTWAPHSPQKRVSDFAPQLAQPRSSSFFVGAAGAAGVAVPASGCSLFSVVIVLLLLACWLVRKRASDCPLDTGSLLGCERGCQRCSRQRSDSEHQSEKFELARFHDRPRGRREGAG